MQSWIAHKDKRQLLVLNLDEIANCDICAAVIRILAADQICTFQKTFSLFYATLSVASLQWPRLLMTFVIDSNFHILLSCTSSAVHNSVFFEPCHNLKWKSRLKLHTQMQKKNRHFDLSLGEKPLYKLHTRTEERTSERANCIRVCLSLFCVRTTTTCVNKIYMTLA